MTKTCSSSMYISSSGSSRSFSEWLLRLRDRLYEDLWAVNDWFSENTSDSSSLSYPSASKQVSSGFVAVPVPFKKVEKHYFKRVHYFLNLGPTCFGNFQ